MKALLHLLSNARMCSRFRVLALLVGSNTIFHSAALASCPAPDIKANGEFFRSDVVFTGTVLSKRYRELKHDRSGWFYRVSVSRVFKGPIQKEFIVYNEDASVRFPLETGREYLLFAYKADGRLNFYVCGNSALLSEAGKAIQQIQSIATTTDGEIEGWVVGDEEGVDVLGIHLVIRSGSRVYRALTDKDGHFQFRVPKGSYAVDFSTREYYVWNTDSLWYDPKHFTLHAGESAALQLRSVRHLQTQH